MTGSLLISTWTFDPGHSCFERCRTRLGAGLVQRQAPLIFDVRATRGVQVPATVQTFDVAQLSCTYYCDILDPRNKIVRATFVRFARVDRARIVRKISPDRFESSKTRSAKLFQGLRSSPLISPTLDRIGGTLQRGCIAQRARTAGADFWDFASGTLATLEIKRNT